MLVVITLLASRITLTVFQREAEHRESLATTIRALRITESEQTTEIVC